MDCPICGAVAENITSPGFDGLGVRCHNCKDFDVADAVLNQLLRSTSCCAWILRSVPLRSKKRGAWRLQANGQ